MLTDDNGRLRPHRASRGALHAHGVEERLHPRSRTDSVGRCRPARRCSSLDGQQLRGLDFRLPRGSVIAGRVSTRRATSCLGVAVRVHALPYQQGNRQLVPAGHGADRRSRRLPRVGLEPGRLLHQRVARAPNAASARRTARLRSRRRAPVSPGRRRRAGGRGGVSGGRGAAASDEPDQLGVCADVLSRAWRRSPKRAQSRSASSQEVLDIDFTSPAGADRRVSAATSAIRTARGRARQRRL